MEAAGKQPVDAQVGTEAQPECACSVPGHGFGSFFLPQLCNAGAKAAAISDPLPAQFFRDIIGSSVIDSAAESSQMEKIYLILWSVSNLS